VAPDELTWGKLASLPLGQNLALAHLCVATSSRHGFPPFCFKPEERVAGDFFNEKAGQTKRLQYVENDLAVSPLKADARSNLFVYLYGRRFSFDLRSGPNAGSSLVIVKDAIAEGENGRR
jgi:hypothetical protein